MFHVEHKTSIVWAASVILGAAQLFAEPCLQLPLATDSEESAMYTELGMQELLLADDTAAAEYFARAISSSDECSPLAYVGLSLSHGKNGSTSQDEKRMLTTPPEEFYLDALLKLAASDIAAAQQAFTRRADEYRADIFTAAWAIQLSHYRDVGYNEDGSIREFQKQALERATELYAQKRDNPIVCYLRALVEQSAPEVSSEALEAAERSVKLLPDHPTAMLLYGHLLYRRAKYKEAASVFSQTWSLAAKQDKKLLALHTRLYESVALWSDGQEKEALKIRSGLNAYPIREDSLSAEDIFLKWESRTLPLRILILRKTPPTAGEISAAVKTALPHGDKEKDPYTQAMCCLRASLTARLHSHQGNTEKAIVELRKAEKLLAFIEEASPVFLQGRPLLITPWKRLHQACTIAVNAARVDVYPSTAESWKDNIRIFSAEISSLQLPPVAPQQK